MDEAVLNDCLAEAPEAARARARTAFDRVAGAFATALVLFGAGGLGRMTLSRLRILGVEPLAFADNNPALWGQTIEGLRVLSPADAARLYGQSAAFVVTIWRAGGGHRFEHSRRQLNDLGCPIVVPAAVLFWKHPEVFLPYFAIDSPEKVLAQADQVRAAFHLLADDRSRREFIDQLRWRLWLDFDGLSSPAAEDQYFPDGLFSWLPDEVFVDCGAYDGDTIKIIGKRHGTSFGRIIAIEPDPDNFAKLESYCASLPAAIRDRIVTHRMATGARRETVRFDASGTASAAIGQGGIEVECVPLDELLAGEAPPTYIKMDVEGAEPNSLAGARGLIQAHQPLLAVCAYHLQDHLWRIPLLIHALSDQYKLYLRPHNEEAFDLVCYAVPPARSLNTPEPAHPAHEATIS